ncbi:hypothetical protein DFH01_18865 [Falsiroseomonas bella]|uniref:PEP-CTERM protein-sorting domain-containing protein n=1 Tax=Falsiroseomonas bella TaxID=2184016 RepID=A0A317FA26_9PROT|nr:hypothetical protein [Falsiroseomonas bella]PWS35655.1 hypothetical protein DFH01_18865 [Falsiroseomonas bella]
MGGGAKRLLAGCFLLLSALRPAEASWFQDTAAASLTARGGLTVTTPFGPPAPVRIGTGFAGQVMHSGEGLGFDVAVDVGPYEIVVRFSADHDRRLADPAGLLDITLSGLSPVPRVILTSFSCPTPAGTCQWPDSPPEASLTDTLPTSLVLGFAALQDGASYVYAIPAPSAVPTPGAFPLMLAGVLGLGAAASRRGGAGRSPCRSGLPRAGFRV